MTAERPDDYDDADPLDGEQPLTDDSPLDGEEEPPHLHGGSPHTDEPAPYDDPNPNVP
jgi:hypothetical protein